MQVKDYFRLAKISLKARKKATRSTVRGIAFGLILLIPVVFLGLGLFVDLNGKVNANPEVLYSSVTAASERTGIADSSMATGVNYDGDRVSYQTALNAFNKLKTKDKVVYEQIYAGFNYNIATAKEEASNGMTNALSFNFQVGEVENPADMNPVYRVGDTSQGGGYLPAPIGGNRKPTYSKTSTDVPFAAIVDLTATGRDDFFTKKYTDKFGDLFVSGYDAGFTKGNSKGEVIISEILIDALGQDRGQQYGNADFYNEPFSIRYRDGFTGEYGSVYLNTTVAPPNENDYLEPQDRQAAYGAADAYFFCEYKVVGIIKKEVTEWAMNATADYSGIPSHYMSNLIFLTTDSLFNGEDTLDPVITRVTEVVEGETEKEDFYNPGQSYLVATYKTDVVTSAELNQEYICLGVNTFMSRPRSDGYYGSGTPPPYSQTKFFADPLTFGEMQTIANVYGSELAGVWGDYAAERAVSEIYSILNMLYSVFMYMVLFLSVMGGIIFFASMVNLFNSIAHSVDSRKGYLGVLRAVGGKRAMINNLYFAESISIFMRALLWILIFSTVICAAIKLLIDFGFGYIGNVLPFALTIGWQYLFIAIGLSLAVLVLLGFLFSYGCSWKVARAPIMETLAN